MSLASKTRIVTGCDRVFATCIHFAKLFQERRGLREMTRQINVLDCQPDVLLLALPHIENKLAQEPLQEFMEDRTFQWTLQQRCLNIMRPLPTMDM